MNPILSLLSVMGRAVFFSWNANIWLNTKIRVFFGINVYCTEPQSEVYQKKKKKKKMKYLEESAYSKTMFKF